MYTGPQGRGFGRGRRFFYQDIPDIVPPGPPITQPYFRESSPEEEKSYLEGIVGEMETELGEIKKRIEELDKKKTE